MLWLTINQENEKSIEVSKIGHDCEQSAKNFGLFHDLLTYRKQHIFQLELLRAHTPRVYVHAAAFVLYIH